MSRSPSGTAGAAVAIAVAIACGAAWSAARLSRADGGAIAARCEPPAAGQLELQDYTGVRERDGHSYYAEVRFDAGQSDWRPVNYIEMPRHHSSRIDWTNLEDFPGLAFARDERLRFTFEFVAAQIEPVPEQDRWRARYRARIAAICTVRADR